MAQEAVSKARVEAAISTLEAPAAQGRETRRHAASNNNGAPAPASASASDAHRAFSSSSAPSHCRRASENASSSSRARDTNEVTASTDARLPHSPGHTSQHPSSFLSCPSQFPSPLSSSSSSSWSPPPKLNSHSRVHFHCDPTPQSTLDIIHSSSGSRNDDLFTTTTTTAYSTVTGRSAAATRTTTSASAASSSSRTPQQPTGTTDGQSSSRAAVLEASTQSRDHSTSRPVASSSNPLIPPPSPRYFELKGFNKPATRFVMSTRGRTQNGSNISQHSNGSQSRQLAQSNSLTDLSHLRPFNDYLKPAHASTADLAQERTEEKDEKSGISWHQRFSIWMINEGNRVIFFGLWILVHVGLFGLASFNYYYSDNFARARSLLGLTLPLARGAALVLHVDSGMILFPVCRTLISWLRSTPLNRVVPFDKAVHFHKAIAWSIVFFSFVHTFAHYVNFKRLADAQPDKYNFWNLMFVSGPGLTGHLMLLFLVIMVLTSLPAVRRKKFEIFWYWHHLFMLFFFCFSFHGAFCLLTPDRPPYCKDISSFWKYWVASGFVYLMERIAREWRAGQKTVISRVILHPSKVVEIQIKKENCQPLAGQYIFLCCPEVSLWQWHPFTLTNAPEEDYLSVHIRIVGDFTKALSKRLGCDVDGVGEWDENLGDRNGLVTVLPRIMIDGPFGAASEDVFKYEVTVLVGAGIGVTPFASVLKSIWYRVNYPTKSTKLHKVYFFWICRDKESFEWFQSLLLALESQDLNQFIEIHTFLTGRLRHSEVGNLMLNEEGAFADTVTGLRARTCFGRPNLDIEFDRIKDHHADTDIGVFFCGPKKMGKQLQACCTKFSSGSTQFIWHKENF